MRLPRHCVPRNDITLIYLNINLQHPLIIYICSQLVILAYIKFKKKQKSIPMKIKQVLKINFFAIAALIMLSASCVSKKQILYMQDLDSYSPLKLTLSESKLQVDDILSITVETLIPIAALPFNKNEGLQQNNNIDIMKLQGYLVSQAKTINFPVLGSVSVANKTATDLEKDLKERLKAGGYLIDPIVTVRLLNAKVTILGEVKQPGTFSFTENNMSFLQCLGLAGDLTINGNREDVILIRNVDGIQTASHLNLTSANWLDGPFQQIKPNDVIIINPNSSKIKTAGYIGNISVFLGVFTVVLSSIILLTNL